MPRSSVSFVKNECGRPLAIREAEQRGDRISRLYYNPIVPNYKQRSAAPFAFLGGPETAWTVSLSGQGAVSTAVRICSSRSAPQSIYSSIFCGIRTSGLHLIFDCQLKYLLKYPSYFFIRIRRSRGRQKPVLFHEPQTQAHAFLMLPEKTETLERHPRRERCAFSPVSVDGEPIWDRRFCRCPPNQETL